MKWKALKPYKISPHYDIPFRLKFFQAFLGILTSLVRLLILPFGYEVAWDMHFSGYLLRRAANQEQENERVLRKNLDDRVRSDVSLPHAHVDHSSSNPEDDSAGPKNHPRSYAAKLLKISRPS